MTDSQPTVNLPAQIADAITGIPKALTPSCLKALDRLVGAITDIPVALLTQKKAKIDAQTQAYILVEQSIAKAVAAEAGTDSETISRALDVLVRKEYRRQQNRGAVAAAMLEDFSSSTEDTTPEIPTAVIEDDWLNVFDRYAEDASTERMQKLWGRVLAGEVRRPGKYSMRTLRFLSEFSQGDALIFADFCRSAFGDTAPNSLVKPNEMKDIRTLIHLESAGLVQGASGMGLSVTMTFNERGVGFLVEGALGIMFRGKPGAQVVIPCCALTTLGQELVTLLPGRDPRSAARAVAHACKSSLIESAHLVAISGPGAQAVPMEILWESDPAQPAIVQ